MTDELLRDARRCMLAFSGQRGPLITPMAFWSDGASLWMTTSASSFKVQRLTSIGAHADHAGAGERPEAGPREAPCAVYIPPLIDAGDEDAGTESGSSGRGLVISGSARAYTLDDPVGLALHWPVISAALAALAVKNAASLTGYARDLPRTPLRWLPTNRVAVRVRMERVRPAVPPKPDSGIAPALPGVVPSGIRRALAGKRQVVVATVDSDGEVSVHPAAVGAGMRLTFAASAVDVGPGTRAVLAMDADPRGRPTKVVGLALHGSIGAGSVLAAERATWWHGFDISGAQIPQRPAGGIVLPD